MPLVVLLLRRRAGLGAGVGFQIGEGDGAGVGTEGVDIGKSIGFSFGNGVLMTDSLSLLTQGFKDGSGSKIGAGIPLVDLLLRRRAGLGAGVGFRIGEGDGAGVGTEGVDIGKSIGFSFGNGVRIT